MTAKQCQEEFGVTNAQARKISAHMRKMDRMKSALQVIYTWANYEGGHILIPSDVKELISRTLSTTK